MELGLTEKKNGILLIKDFFSQVKEMKLQNNGLKN